MLFTTTIEKFSIKGSEYDTEYRLEVTAEINPGCRESGDYYRGFVPSEGPSVERIVCISVEEAIDYRFGKTGVILDFVASGVTEKEAGQWVWDQIDSDTEELEEMILEKYERELIANSE